jgi:uncharacterized protein YxjI
MSKLLNNNFFLIKEHIGLLKVANNYDIYNPETSEMVMICREMQLGVLTKIFRFTKYKIMTPFHVEVMSTREEPIFSVKRGVSIFGFSPVTVFDQNGLEIGQLQRKFRLGGAKIDITDIMNNRLFTLKGNLIGWEFKITNEDLELATISKKWAGLGKELFTSADNYVLSIDNQVENDAVKRSLILGAVLCVDFLLKE